MAADPYRPDPWKTLGKLVGSLFAVAILGAGLLLPYVGGLGVVAGHAAGKFLDTNCTLQESQPPQKTTVYARDGKTIIATLFSQDRVPIPLSQIPKALQDALVATEDRRFYKHHGVDLRGLFRSALSTSGGDTQGGSTLTMQYVKQVRYYQAINDPKKQQAAIAVNLHRKMEDAKCAIYIEKTLHESKDTILNNYLNIAFFGEHSYGIQTAAETYFNKPASRLTLAESALLVGLLRAPSDYDPFLNRAAAKERRDQVLQNLVAVHKLSQAKADEVKATPVALASSSPPRVKQGCANSSTTVHNAAFFCEYVADWLETVNGIKSSDLQTGGLKIVTTLDPTLQNRIQAKINRSVPPTSTMTAVEPVIDPHTGDVLAMGASKRYGLGRGETEQPMFTKYTAQGASTFKLFPLLVALSTGVPSDWKLTTVGSFGTFKPKNCATRSSSINGDANVNYNATESLASATAKSSNSFFVGLADELLDCNLQPIVDMMAKLGMRSLQEHNPKDSPQRTIAQTIVDQDRAQQVVLGSVETSPLELAGAYAAIANGGKYNLPAPVLSINDSRGQTVAVKRTAGVQVVAPQVAAQAVDILSGDTKGVGTSAGVFDNWYAGNPSIIAGKTGTNAANSRNNSSVWFVGMTPNLVASTAVINFDNSSAPSSGLVGERKGAAYGDFAAKVWLQTLQSSLRAHRWEWPNPDDIGSEVPDIAGQSLADAKRQLDEAGYKMVRLDAADNLTCPSAEPFDTVGLYGPHRAAAGTTITVCVSKGTLQHVVIPVIPKPRKRTGGARATTSSGVPNPKPTSSKPGHGHGH
ncbi:MAG: transglycosylase domain-containing protein [Jatrophihabitans sp.]|uniref:transglycosylase domain-containing protein n=1 Tax=Jatrophihabitans sp. TaxID=1932789 RepID=UPI003912BFC2